jgi:hypothetical protein
MVEDTNRGKNDALNAKYLWNGRDYSVLAVGDY